MKLSGNIHRDAALTSTAARHDAGPPLPETQPGLCLPDRHGLAHTGTEQEQAEDGRALQRPDRVAVEVEARKTRVVQARRR